MLIHSETFERSLSKPPGWEDHVFQFCTFHNLDGEGLHVTSHFIDCEFEGGDFYWVIFNLAVFVGVTFKNCRFRGCSFAGCRMVECVFEHCEFDKDALDGDCTFTGSRWYACKQQSTQGLRTEYAALP